MLAPPCGGQSPHYTVGSGAAFLSWSWVMSWWVKPELRWWSHRRLAGITRVLVLHQCRIWWLLAFFLFSCRLGWTLTLARRFLSTVLAPVAEPVLSLLFLAVFSSFVALDRPCGPVYVGSRHPPSPPTTTVILVVPLSGPPSSSTPPPPLLLVPSGRTGLAAPSSPKDVRRWRRLGGRWPIGNESRWVTGSPGRWCSYLMVRLVVVSRILTR
jgi:hypothetical protein